jgi:hypothetical protein
MQARAKSSIGLSRKAIWLKPAFWGHVPAGGKDTGLKGESDWITGKKEGICSLWAPARMN